MGDAYFSIKLQVILAVSLVDKQSSASKKSNIKRHYETHKFVGTRKKQKLCELKPAPREKQNIFHAVINAGESAVNASYSLSQLISSHSKPITESQLI
jgi:hypothetical protein